MKRKLTAILLTLAMVLTLLPMTALAAGTPPASVGAPRNFAISAYSGSIVFATVSAPDDLRALVDMTDEERGYHMSVRMQVDVKIDNGSWQYTPDWDTNGEFLLAPGPFGGDSGAYIGHDRQVMKEYPNLISFAFSDSGPSWVWDWYKTHTVTARARFVLDCHDGAYVLSPWSAEYVLSDSSKMDHKKIMNESKPALVSSSIEYRGDKPHAIIQLEKSADAIQLLNAASGDSVMTEIWLRLKGDKDFKLVDDDFFSNEKLLVDVTDYFEGVTDFKSAAYEIKCRYKLDEGSYQQSGVEAGQGHYIYGPYSNTLTYNMPAYSGSTWATDELKKADELGLIPESLKTADLTKSITRAEFAAVAVKVFENLSGTSALPAVTNPFTDTKDVEVLKAYNAGIMVGVSADKFEPNTLLNREQAATALTRVFKRATMPGWSFADDAKFPLTFTQPAKFADDAKISDWAKPSVYFMVENGVITGVGDNKFAPRATTTEEQAKGYASATREQAIVIAVRMVEKLG